MKSLTLLLEYSEKMSDKMTKLFFFIGTEAELIKVFPIIIEAQKRGLNYYIIASGQNDIVNSKILSTINCGKVDLELSLEKDIKKSATGLLTWWIKTYKSSIGLFYKVFPNVDFVNSKMIVHGDTVSTYMGALIGKKLGMTVCHVEAGLRSHNLLSTFPEEIDRLLTSRIARVHFAPGDEPCNNLKKARGRVVNTVQNTLIDSLNYSNAIPVGNEKIRTIISTDYFVFVMHRQENLVNKTFVADVVKEIINAAKNKKCIILLHKITENAFIKFGLMDELKKNENIEMLPRVDYFDFMKLLQNSAFVITDGGSNQEELYYMNKPCLILRKTTERSEGLGINARLFNGSASDIREFIKEAQGKTVISENASIAYPSKRIVDILIN